MEKNGKFGYKYHIYVFSLTMIRSILILDFIENRRPNVGWPSNKKPDIVFSQAYHRFFKEQFDVVVLPKKEK